MKTLNKEFSYRGFVFNIKVELHAENERRIGGKTKHRVTSNCMGANNYYRISTCEDYELIDTIETETRLIYKYVDGILDNEEDVSPIVKELTDLGFK